MVDKTIEVGDKARRTANGCDGCDGLFLLFSDKPRSDSCCRCLVCAKRGLKLAYWAERKRNNFICAIKYYVCVAFWLLPAPRPLTPLISHRKAYTSRTTHIQWSVCFRLRPPACQGFCVGWCCSKRAIIKCANILE